MNGPPYQVPPPPPPRRSELRAPLARLLADPGARIGSFCWEPVAYESWSRAADGVALVHGMALTRTGAQRFSMVLKRLRHRPWQPLPGDLARQIDDGGDGPGDWCLWEREALARESGLLGELPGRFSTARCLGIERSGDGRLSLWLEHVEGLAGAGWDAGEVLAAAGDLGAFHARYFARPPVASAWLCRPFAEQGAAAHRAGLADHLHEACTSRDPALRALFPPWSGAALRAVWRHGPAVLRTLPRTLVHRDLIPGNLFRTATGTVAVDWGQVGLGPAGEDLATLVLASAPAARLTADEIADLGADASRRHRAGLRGAGQNTGPGPVGVGYRVTAALHFGTPVARTAARLLALPRRALCAAADDADTRRRIEVMLHHLACAQGDLPAVEA